jgi:predicted DNA binding protein
MSVTHVAEAEGDDVSYRQVELKLWHAGCWTLEVTDSYPDTHILEKSLYPTDDRIKGDFVLVSTGETDIETFAEAIDAHPVVHEVAVLKRSGNRVRAVVNYERTSSIVPEIVNSEFMPIEPVYITGGSEYWTVLARSDSLRTVVAAMEEEYDVDISSIHEVAPEDSVAFANVVDEASNQLSPRQAESLCAAREAGYYNWPREVSAGEVAEDLDVSGPTLLEHLRKAEHKVLDAFMDEFQKHHVQEFSPVREHR